MAVLKHSENLFLAAGGTGLAAVARLLETASEGATGHAVVAVPSDYDVKEYFPKTQFDIHAIDPARFAHEIVAKATRLTTPGETRYAFFAGEFQNAQDLRKMFKTRLHLDKTSQLSTAYWRQGVPGHGS